MRAAMLTVMPRMVPSWSAAQQHRSGVDAHAHVAAGLAEVAQHALAQASPFVQQGQATVHGALGVILLRPLGAEGGQQVVPRVLQHAAAVGNDDFAATGQHTVHHGADLFRVQALAQRRRPHHVEEQHRHLAQVLHRRLQPRQLGLQRGQRRVDHGVAQQGALRLQRFDGSQQSRLVAHGAVQL
ncbi:MAG TPA: hypothetical protein PLF63_14890 [Rubrivivax sp.]|nr:hypothetical protein [Rubrivivax sp.]